MAIKIRYFASLKEQLGRSEYTLPFNGPVTVNDVWLSANTNHPLPDNLLVAINMEYADLNALVNDDDEVAFFPPVTGG